MPSNFMPTPSGRLRAKIDEVLAHPSASYVNIVVSDAINSVGYFKDEMRKLISVVTVTTKDTRKEYSFVLFSNKTLAGGEAHTLAQISSKIKYRLGGNTQSAILYKQIHTENHFENSAERDAAQHAYYHPQKEI